MTVGSAATSTAAAWPVRPAEEERSEATSAPLELRTESWGEKLYAAFPLFLVGGACLAVAVDLFYTGVSGQFGANRSVHLELWTLFLALAVTGLAAGTFAMVMEEEPEVIAPGATPVARTSVPAPAWDESTVEPDREPSLLGPRLWERRPDLTEGPVAEPMPAASILSELDELAASLRKRPPPPKTE